jgi:hypothetical protein
MGNDSGILAKKNTADRERHRMTSNDNCGDKPEFKRLFVDSAKRDANGTYANPLPDSKSGAAKPVGLYDSLDLQTRAALKCLVEQT